jgi:hypothetical protein
LSSYMATQIIYIQKFWHTKFLLGIFLFSYVGF